MDYLIVTIASLIVSGLTLYSGFGLGTVLMPIFALFFPLPVSISATAVVHLANNIFKVFLVGRQADRGVVLRFALPAAAAAMIGAALLGFVAAIPPLFSSTAGGSLREVTMVKIIIGVLILGFAVFELSPRLSQLSFDRRYLPLGGILSGFFGGLSGNQGALRSAFLINAGLSKQAYIGTGTVAAVIVDFARLFVYGWGFYATRFSQSSGIAGLVIAASLAAFVGAFVGQRLIEKVTLRAIQRIVGVLLILVSLGMLSGYL